jgi:hypothetical protein
MTHRLASFASTLLAAVLIAVCVPAMSQGTAPAPAAADAWPREIRVDSGSVLLHQPQVNTWDGIALDFRAVVEVKAATSGKDTFGVVWATARTLIDRQDRMVTLQGLKFTRAKFPALPDNGTALLASLQKSVDATPPRPVSLDRLQASLTAAKDQLPAGVVVANTPPRIIVSNTPALLISIDGAPVVKAAGTSRFERVINTRALILKLRETWYLHVYDGWMSADRLDGPWTKARAPLGADDVAQTLAKSGTVDLLDGGPDAKPKPTLAAGAPAIYVSQVPAELIVFTGAPDFAPISQTTLLWATNAQGDVFVDTTDNSYYVLLSGRWYRGGGLNGPWAYVAHNALPPSFARIPPGSLAGVVLASVAGTPQAQEAVIASQIPQTATVPRQGGPKFAPTFDGAPVLRPIDGTPLSYVANTPAPIIRVDASTFYGVQAGVWFAASAVTGPWVVAAQVPEVIYTIPPSSPLHYVTYVRIYETTPTVVYTGYTPGYYGSVVTASGVVVYGTGYAYSPWVGSVYYPFPLTYGLGAYPVYNPAVGFAFGFAFGAAYASWYHPAYYGMPCCGAYGASANVYRSWGNTVSSGTRSWYSVNGTAGTRAAGGYANARTGTTGTYSAGRSVDAWSGTAQQGYNRTYNTATGASGSTSRGERYDADTGVHSYGSSTSVTGAGGGSVDRNVAAAAAGPAGGTAAARQTTVDNARTGQSNTFGSAKVGDSHFASVDGNVYRNSGGGWEQHNPQSGGWGQAGGDTSWAQRESQARSASESRFSSFQGGGGFGGGRFGGFGGGGFRGRR